MREPKEACELIEKITFEIQTMDVQKNTATLILCQHANLLEKAAEGTEEDVRTLLIDLEIRNRLFDQLLITSTVLQMAIDALPKEGKLRSKLILVQRAGAKM